MSNLIEKTSVRLDWFSTKVAGMALQQRRIDDILDTIWTIAASPYVQHYTIGYTARAAHDRFKEHRANGRNHLVVLADKLTRVDASRLETTLQFCIRADRRHTNYRKYDPDRRDGPIYPSVGQANPQTASERIHSVYMVWSDRE
ncbi:hypothetical protein [Novosphingobium sp.]|uniref:hypothetical protein n=1 Tax=Novosphingobium sp. TaxID=1874826 RepID=UPI0026279985|nr:hypothetical protein [Novosphingobium sp.]